MVVVVVVMPVRLSVRCVVAFAKVLVVLVTNAVMFPIISRRTIPGGPRRVVVVVVPSRVLVVRVSADVVVIRELVVVGLVDKVLLPVVRGGIVLLNPGIIGVELRVVGMLVVLGRPLELEGMSELEDGKMDELLGRMLELGVGVAELENGLDDEVDVPAVALKDSVTVTVTVAMGTKQLLAVMVAVLVIVIGARVVTLGGQAAQSAVAISQMAVDRVGEVRATVGVVRVLDVVVIRVDL